VRFVVKPLCQRLNVSFVFTDLRSENTKINRAIVNVQKVGKTRSIFKKILGRGYTAFTCKVSYVDVVHDRGHYWSSRYFRMTFQTL
jgi:hypothetical protein